MASEFVIIVPARAGSSRLPNKPLAQIDGTTLLERVYELAQSSNATAIYIATDNEAIRDHAQLFGAEVIMTSEGSYLCDGQGSRSLKINWLVTRDPYLKPTRR